MQVGLVPRVGCPPAAVRVEWVTGGDPDSDTPIWFNGQQFLRDGWTEAIVGDSKKMLPAYYPQHPQR